MGEMIVGVAQGDFRVVDDRALRIQLRSRTLHRMPRLPSPAHRPHPPPPSPAHASFDTMPRSRSSALCSAVTRA